ncbi:tRNA(Ile)-lysidine synthase [Allostella vacuolata]|nr:tRNA(Ile)-lysidine synthase [Stella vacuolata]
MPGGSASASAADLSAAGERDGPIAAAEFAAAMDRLGPFENRPAVAVAVSGGPDSLALTLLADAWARRQGGCVVALTVDHGLRAEAAAEAATVGRWLAARGIAHRILSHTGPRPATRIQEAARRIRYGLLLDACRGAGILHLLLAHHRDDQAETVAIRTGRGSGPDGLAGMAPVRETPEARLLRPLLGQSRRRLVATLAAHGQPSIADPSNLDRRYDRARLRQDGLDAETLLAAAARAAAARAGEEQAVAHAAADLVWLAPEGYALLDAAGLARRPGAIRVRLLAGLLAAIGTAAPYGPRGAALARLAEQVVAGRSPRTLAGCHLLPWRDRVLVCREASAIGPDVPVARDFAAGGGGILCWDDRFTIAVPARMPISWRVARLGGARPAGAGLAAVPGPVRPTLPAVWNGGRLMAVPSVAWTAGPEVPQLHAVFRPLRALAGGPFAVV